jgi:hypothetical protein
MDTSTKVCTHGSFEKENGQVAFLGHNKIK